MFRMLNFIKPFECKKEKSRFNKSSHKVNWYFPIQLSLRKFLKFKEIAKINNIETGIEPTSQDAHWLQAQNQARILYR
jgi:hypothetical protein